jgi:hypothetical protein
MAEYYGTNNGTNPPPATPPPGNADGYFDVLWSNGKYAQYAGNFMIPANATNPISIMQWDNQRISPDPTQFDYGGIVLTPQQDYPRTFKAKLVRGRTGTGGSEEDLCAGAGAGGCQSFVVPTGRWVYIWVWQILGDNANGHIAGNYVLFQDGTNPSQWVIWGNPRANTYGRPIDRIRYGLTPRGSAGITDADIQLPMDNIWLPQG